VPAVSRRDSATRLRASIVLHTGHHRRRHGRIRHDAHLPLVVELGGHRGERLADVARSVVLQGEQDREGVACA
jgi:hypothetical protein